jgi:hypothetical protein
MTKHSATALAEPPAATDATPLADAIILKFQRTVDDPAQMGSRQEDREKEIEAQAEARGYNKATLERLEKEGSTWRGGSVPALYRFKEDTDREVARKCGGVPTPQHQCHYAAIKAAMSLAKKGKLPRECGKSWFIDVNVVMAGVEGAQKALLTFDGSKGCTLEMHLVAQAKFAILITVSTETNPWNKRKQKGRIQPGVDYRDGGCRAKNQSGGDQGDDDGEISARDHDHTTEGLKEATYDYEMLPPQEILYASDLRPTHLCQHNVFYKRRRERIGVLVTPYVPNSAIIEMCIGKITALMDAAQVLGEERELLMEYFIPGNLTYKDIAATHGIAPKTVQRRIKRTLAKLTAASAAERAAFEEL